MTIYWLNADPIGDLKDANCATKRLRKKNSELTLQHWHKLLRREHSTLRFLSLVVHDEDCPYSVASHIVRHTKEHTQPVMSSGRPDKTGKERDYTSTRWLHVKFTPVGLIRMMEDRLCTEAEAPTIEWAQRLLKVMVEHEDPYIRVLGNTFCLPTCMKVKYCKNDKDCCKEVRQ